ncbi:MAG TPA: protein kinase [Gemmatimonadaceae bacterium]
MSLPSATDPMEQHDQSLELAAILTDRYRIERQLGAGGMATVYLAHDLKLEREVALKVLRPELGAVLGSERFLAEVKITARLDHPHILTLIDSGSAGGLLYYVLPYVRGESLRDLLNRESQLGVDQALAITKQVGSALDYAHRKGVVHRDIKPENILLQEGEAMLADFGIALAVQESGGNRLTETGLSLGTPHYMSPEQATGSRSLDARSDLYSLASVLYEMLVGEPPMTGKTVQAVIAKLLTEPAMHVRTVRDTVPETVDAAIAKALSKVPADRFTNVSDFLRALDTPMPSATPHATTGVRTATAEPQKSRKTLIVGATAAVVVIGAVAALAAMGKFKRVDTSANLRERTQLTFTGNAAVPALSADGKQLAYFTKSCNGADCRYALDMQDVGSTTTRHIFEGATAAYGLEWSPDRRNLLMNGTIDGRFGTYLVSALGGTPRLVTPGVATFFAGGDSLIIGPSDPSDSAFVVRFAGLDGAVRDSVRVAGPGTQLASLVSIPGTSRFVSMVIQPPRGLWRIHERNGTVTDKLLNSCTCGASASHDALWMTRAGPTAAEAVVRVAVDPASGKFAAHQDTIYSGRFTNIAVTADGGTMAVDDGSFAYSVVAADVPSLLAGKIGSPFLNASNRVMGTVSPDGNRILIERSVPGADGRDEMRLAVAPFAGGAETAVGATGSVRGAAWADSTTLAVYSFTPSGSRMAATDVRTGVAGAAVDRPDSIIVSSARLADGSVWIPKTRDRLIVERGGKRQEMKTPAWFASVFQVDVSADGSRIAILGWNKGSNDTLGVYVAPVAGGAFQPWTQSFAEQGQMMWLNDGSIAFTVWSGTDAATIYKLTGSGARSTVGAIPHVANALTLSRDLKRATLGWREHHGDAWMYKVVRP